MIDVCMCVCKEKAVFPIKDEVTVMSLIWPYKGCLATGVDVTYGNWRVSLKHTLYTTPTPTELV